METEISAEKSQKTNIFSNRQFLLLFMATLISSPGYYIYLIGSEWLMLTIDDNRFYFGMLFVAASIPRLLFLSVGGVVADRFSKSKILFFSDLTRALLIGAILILVFTETVNVWHLIVMAMMFGISDAFSYPATNSLVPSILDKEQFQKGNSLIQMTTLISPIFGPAIGGTMIAFIGFQGVFTVAFVMLLLASMIVIFIKHKNFIEKEGKNPWLEFVEGFHYARKHEVIRSIMVIALIVNLFLTGPISIGLPLIVKDVFFGDAISLAIVESSLGLGSLIGTIVLVIVTLKKPGKFMVSSLTLLGILYTIVGFAYSLFITAALVLFMAIFIQFMNIPLITSLQKTTKKVMIGRMMSFLMTVSTGLVPISFFITSVIISFGIGIQKIMIICGILITIVAIITFRNKKILSLI